MKLKNLVIALIFTFASTPVAVYAGTLQSCKGISTPNGYKYVGTYCVDYQCTHVVRYVFDSYCPYNI